MKTAQKIVAAAIVACALAACAGTATQTATTASMHAPKLVVFIAIDGLPEWQVSKYAPQFAPDGFRRFLDQGTWFANANYSHAHTVTAVGHATMLTGASPAKTGIIANEWLDPATGETVYNTMDERYTYIGHATARLDGTSPNNLRAESLGDVLKRVSPASKVIGISGKDRGAILPAGKAGVAYMYMDDGEFASTTYYMNAHPAWVDAFNHDNFIFKYYRQVWQPLLDDAAYKDDVPDGQKWFNGPGKLPMVIGDADAAGVSFDRAVMASPFGDIHTLAFARAAIAGEDLGKDDAPDILAISLSSHDYINHAYGAESRLSHDHTLHLDRALQDFFHDLDATVGKGSYIAVLTADHGFMPTPEYTQSLGKDAGRIVPADLAATINTELGKQFGAGKWVLGNSANGVLLNKRFIETKNVDYAALAQAARDVIRKQPGIATAWTKSEVPALSDDVPLAVQHKNALVADRAPDIIVALKRNWMFSSKPVGTTHGSPWEYDTHVPVLFYDGAHAGLGRVKDKIDVKDIAPTLASLLGIPAPAQSEGKALRVEK